jgi:hypothetical protein
MLHPRFNLSGVKHVFSPGSKVFGAQDPLFAKVELKLKDGQPLLHFQLD